MSRFIEASAGTGKTYKITQIVKQLVETEKIDLDQILIVTYTEKAAGELKDRIRKALQNTDAIEKVDNASIFTIHSFCQSILREFSFEAGESFGQTLIDDAQIKDFIEQKIRDEWADKGFDDEFVKSVVAASKLYYPGLKLKDSLSYQFGVAKTIDDVDGLRQTLDFFYNHPGTEKKTKEEIQSLLAGNWENGDEILKGKAEKRFPNGLFGKIKFFKTESKTPSKEKDFIIEHIDEIYNSWKQYKAENGYQSYNDMIDRVRENVLRGAQLLQAIKSKYKIGIIDEFQDTNQRQWDIFSTIFLNDPQHKLIVVGDPKQSIFSFQGADLSVYKSAINEMVIKGIQTENLDINYRSTDAMVKACNALFNLEPFCKSLSYKDVNPSGKIQPSAKINKPLLIQNPEDSNYFDLACKKIIELVTNGTQIWDKEKEGFRNIKLKDFAILCRTRSECPPIIDSLQKFHIPYLRYKDKNLFSSKECSMWITLFKALNEEDFNGENERIFNEVLLTDFFRTKSKNDESMRIILSWQKLLQEGKYAALLEAIYEQSSINEVYSSVKHASSLGIIHQIGDYSINFLYQKNSSADTLIRHLENLKNNSESLEDNNGNIVQKSNDFDAVQILTIHASKGLEFPVVISVIGQKALTSIKETTYLYHENDEAILSHGAFAKEQYRKERKEELDRLFYVAYTRASYLMILPTTIFNDKGDMETLTTVFSEANLNGSLKGHYEYLAVQNLKDEEWRKKMQDFLKKPDEESDDPAQNQQIAEINDSMPRKLRRMHSYSSLTYHNNSENKITDSGRPFDGVAEEVPETEQADEVYTLVPEPEGFPRGAKLGNALHNVMEALCKGEKGLNFTDLRCSSEEAIENKNMRELVSEKFQAEGLLADEESWIGHSISLVWNSLNAVLEGGIVLGDLEAKNALAEMEYYLDSSNLEKNFKAFCKGFMDLVFRKDDRYYILDWKSDLLDSYDSQSVEARVEDHYHIQRILYPYVLIKWLSTILKKDEETIFNEHFGGIYYLFFRGAKANSSQGTYLRKWSNYQELKEEYFDKVGKKIYAIALN